MGVGGPEAEQRTLGKMRPDRTRLFFFLCPSVPTDIKEHETGVTSSPQLRVMAMLCVGTGARVGQSGRGGWAAAGGPSEWALGEPRFHEGWCRRSPAGTSREPARPDAVGGARALSEALLGVASRAM